MIKFRKLQWGNYLILGFPGGSGRKESACNVGHLGLIPGLGRSPGGKHSNPLRYSCLENPQGQRSLVGCTPWGCSELATTEWLSTRLLLSGWVQCNYKGSCKEAAGGLGSQKKMVWHRWRSEWCSRKPQAKEHEQSLEQKLEKRRNRFFLRLSRRDSDFSPIKLISYLWPLEL